MRALGVAMVVVALAAAACQSGDKKAGGGGAVGGAGESLGEGGLFRRKPAEASAAFAAPTKIRCATAIPPALIAKHLPATKTEWGEPFDNGEGSFITACRFFDSALAGGTIVRYKCGPSFADARRTVPCVIEIDEMGGAQLTDRDGFLADLDAALTSAAAM